MHTLELPPNVPDKPSLMARQWVTLPHRVHSACPRTVTHASKSESLVESRNLAGPSGTSSKPPQREPIWKRRGGKPIVPLKLDPLICCDVNWPEKIQELDPLMQIVYDTEWVIRKDYFEAHDADDVLEGVVINPPAFPAWYKLEHTGKVVPAQFPYCTEFLLAQAQKDGFHMDRIIQKMGSIVAEYSQALVHPKRRSAQEILILAGRTWQGAAAIHAARRLKAARMNVSVYTHNGTTRSEEELEFMNAGGKIYRNLKDMKGKKFRVVIVAVENQYMGRATVLPLFGEWLQHAVVVFLDPPVLKCSYVTALQVACKGTYNISQKTVIFNPCQPKCYVLNKFIDLYVVDVGIPPSVFSACGMEYFDFRTSTQQYVVQQVYPQPFTVKGSKIYFYKDGEQVS